MRSRSAILLPVLISFILLPFPALSASVTNPLGDSPAQDYPQANLPALPGAFQGRLAIEDEGDCNPGSLHLYEIPAKTCYEFLRRFHPQTGEALDPEAGILGFRPLTATVDIGYGISNRSANAYCPKVTAQSDLNGFFQVKIPECYELSSPPRWMQPRSDSVLKPDRIEGRVQLFFKVPRRRSTTTTSWFRIPAKTDATIRALWMDTQLPPNFKAPFSAPVYTKGSGDNEEKFLYPAFEFALSFKPGFIPNEAVIKLPLAEKIPPEYLQSVLKTLVNWQTLIELHHRLRKALQAESQDDLYFEKVFVTEENKNCHICYTLSFTNTSSLSLGKNGLMLLSQLRPDIIWSSDGGPNILGHEFGHGIQFGFAPLFENIGDGERRFSSPGMNSQGEETFIVHHEMRIHDYIVAYVEGSATALGQYLVHGCNATWKAAVSTAINFPYPWTEPSDWIMDPSCDAEEHCMYHRFRWHMNKRGVAEGSPEWNTRLDRLNAFHQNQLATKVTSSNEARYASFICDILTKKTDIAHLYPERMDLPVSNDLYQDDSLYWIAKILDGHVPPEEGSLFRAYSADVGAKDFQISFLKFLEAMDQFCPECSQVDLPLLGDPAYPYYFVSAHGPLAPQSLGLYLVKEGHMTESQLNNILRASFMEEIKIVPPPKKIPQLDLSHLKFQRKPQPPGPPIMEQIQLIHSQRQY